MFKYINFTLFLKNDFSREIAGKSNENITFKKKGIEFISFETQKRIEELKYKIEVIKSCNKLLLDKEKILKKGLITLGNIEDKEYIEISIKIDSLQNELKLLGEKSSEIRNDLLKILKNFQYEIDELSKGEKKINNNIDYEYFLKIPKNERIKYFSKNNVNYENIISGRERIIIFTFILNGKLNKKLSKSITAGQLLPNEIASVYSNGEIYERIGLSGEFYNKKNKKLIIKESTKIEINDFQKENSLVYLRNEVWKKYNYFIQTNPVFGSLDYRDTIIELYSQGLKDNDIIIILNGNYKNINNLEIKETQKLLNIINFLKNSGFLDHFMYAGQMVKELENIPLRRNGKNNFYPKLNNNDKTDFKENNFYEKEGNLDNFISIALSQLGTKESNGGADKYFKEIGYDKLKAKKIPWCGAFINRCLMKAGYNGTGSFYAKSFINSSGIGHVGIKFGDKIIGGNQSNKVSLVKIDKPIVGYAIPSENGLIVYKDFKKNHKIPDGAILVFSRNKNGNFT